MKQVRHLEERGATKSKQVLSPAPPKAVLNIRNIQTQLLKQAQKPAMRLQILEVKL